MELCRKYLLRSLFGRTGGETGKTADPTTTKPTFCLHSRPSFVVKANVVLDGREFKRGHIDLAEKTVAAPNIVGVERVKGQEHGEEDCVLEIGRIPNNGRVMADDPLIIEIGQVNILEPGVKVIDHNVFDSDRVSVVGERVGLHNGCRSGVGTVVCSLSTFAEVQERIARLVGIGRDTVPNNGQSAAATDSVANGRCQADHVGSLSSSKGASRRSKPRVLQQNIPDTVEPIG